MTYGRNQSGAPDEEIQGFDRRWRTGFGGARGGAVFPARSQRRGKDDHD